MADCYFGRYEMNCKTEHFSRVILGAVIGAALLAGAVSADAKGPPEYPTFYPMPCPPVDSTRTCGSQLDNLCDAIVDANEYPAGFVNLSDKDRNALIVKAMSTDQKLLEATAQYPVDVGKIDDAIEKVEAIQDKLCQLVQQGEAINGDCDGTSKKSKLNLADAETIYRQASYVRSCIYGLLTYPAITGTQSTTSTELTVIAPVSSTEVIVTEPASTEAATTESATTESATTEPATTEPATTEPATTESATTEPATTEVATTEPTTTEPTTTEASTTEASTTEASTTEASTTEASTTEASTTEPATTEATITEPATTEATITEASTTEATATEEPSTTL